MQTKEKKIIKIFNIFLLFIVLLIIRLIYLQITQKSKFKVLGERNFLRTKKISPIRGELIDCNGIILASNRPVFDLYWQGYGKKQLSLEQLKNIKDLEQILNLDFKTSNIYNKIIYACKFSKKILIQSDINFDYLAQICEQCSTSSNIIIENKFERIYPYHNLASHVLGYLSSKQEDYTTIGISGIEKLFQEELKGQVGSVLKVINSYGKTLDEKKHQKSIAGRDIKLTLDLKLQYIVENLFEKDQAGAFILMDPENGAIRSLISFPNFDPNLFLKPISTDVWNDNFIVNNPFLNRATRALYPPASIFKLVTFAAGLEQGIINSDTKFNCKGFTNFCGRKYHCIRRWGHGTLDAKAALAYSCNIPCFKIAKKLHINQLVKYAYKFGLGKPTKFLLPEYNGLIPTIEWKITTKGERWWKGETLSTSIGQSYTLVTPLQVVRLISSICTGYLIKPRILENDQVEFKPLKISQKTLKFLREALRNVVLKGSAKNLGKIKNFEVYAKTGTAQTSSLETQKVVREHLEHAWLAAYFRYKNESPLAFVVVVEHEGSSLPAKKIAEKFLRLYKNMKEIEIKKV